MARRGTEKRRLLGQLNVRLPVDLLERLRVAATADGLTNAAWTRALVARTFDDASSMPTPPTRRSRPVPKPEIVEVARLREVVGEAVGTLRQVAGLDRSREGARLQDVDGAITRLVSVATLLDETKARLLSGDVS